MKYNMDEPQKHDPEWKKPVPKDHLQDDVVWFHLYELSRTSKYTETESRLVTV